MRTRTAAVAAALCLLAAPALAGCAGNGGLAALTDRSQTASDVPDSTDGFPDQSASPTPSDGGSSSGFPDDSTSPTGPSDGSDSQLAVCETLSQDLEAIQQAITSSAGHPNEAQTKLAPLKAKLDQDSQAGDAAVQKAVDEINTDLSKLTDDAKAGNRSGVDADADALDKAAEDFDTACTS